VVRVAASSPNVVSRYDDPPDEILDLGKPPRRQGGTSRSLPPLHIGGQPDEDDGASTRPSWWQWAVLTVAVAAGVIAGAIGANARRDAAEIAAAEATVRLIAGEPMVTGFGSGAGLQLPLLNAGPQEVEVLWVRPDGWTIPPEAEPDAVRLPPDSWVPVRPDAVPDCTQGPGSSTVELRVRTTAREHTISLEVPSGTALSELHGWVCDASRQVDAYVEDVDVVEPLQPDTLTMRLSMKSYDPGVRFTLVDITTSAPGYRMIDATVPVQFERGARAVAVDITWQIVGCDATQTLNDVTLGLELEDDQGRGQESGTPLPGRGVAELARFAIAECGAAG
jgi:hypothetical protein